MEFGMGLNGMNVKISDFPERISISPVHRQKRDDDFYLVDRKAFPGKGTEYLRSDLAQAMVAKAREDALREAAEVTDKFLMVTTSLDVEVVADAKERILALIDRTAEGDT